MADMAVIEENPYTNKFTFVYLNIGMGDCSLIRCPNGAVIIIDCGIRRDIILEEINEARELLRTDNWAGGQENTVYAVILTHPDRDHYTQIWQLLNVGEDDIQPKLNVRYLYYSGSLNDYSLGNIGGYFKATNIPDQFHRVNISQDDDDNNGVLIWSMDDDEEDENDIVIDHSYLVTGGKVKVEDEDRLWTVNILASQVARIQDIDPQRPDDNAGSIVTLCSFHTGEVWGGIRRALFLGDATFSTESFMQAFHNATLDTVDIVQIAHHGSSNTSSSQPFVNLVNPQSDAVVSVGYLEHDNFHPRYSVINRWFQKLPSNDSSGTHRIDCWLTEDSEIPAKNTKAEIPVDWFNYNDILKYWFKKYFAYVHHNNSKTFWWLKDFVPSGTDANGEKVEPIIAVYTPTGYLLKVFNIKRDVYATANGRVTLRMP